MGQEGTAQRLSEDLLAKTAQCWKDLEADTDFTSYTAYLEAYKEQSPAHARIQKTDTHGRKISWYRDICIHPLRLVDGRGFVK
jgi:hypothetical protein